MTNLIYFLTVLIFLTSNCVDSSVQSSLSTLLTCYTTTELPLGSFDAQLCTHLLLIGSCGLHDNATIALPSDKFIRRYTRLKDKNPELKVLITIGPQNDVMSRLVLIDEHRKQFITDIVSFMARNQLDGFDFDWEFPSWEPTGGSPTDRAGFVQLLKEINAAFNNKYLLFVTVAAPYTIVDASYDVVSINKYADYVQIMNYDFHVYSPQVPFTGFNAPLAAEEYEISVLSRMNSDYSTRYWQLRGLDVKKLIFGIPTYGRGFELSSPTAHGLYAPAVGHSSYGESVRYSTICVILREGGSMVGRVWSQRAASPYLFMGTDWITYEDVKSVRYKARYALRNVGAAGIMVYALQTDDYLGVCDKTGHHTFPLVRAIRDEIQRFHNSSGISL